LSRFSAGAAAPKTFFSTGPTNTILANVSHPAMRAAAFALTIFFIHALGDVISPVIIGIVQDKYSLKDAFYFVSVFFIIGSVLWGLGARFLARDTELAPMRAARFGQ